jgi:hypothetical protein
MALPIPNLTPNRVRILQSALSDTMGVVTRPYLPGFEGVTWDRNAKALCGCGYLKPYVHGGFEITDTGRAALTGGSE